MRKTALAVAVLAAMPLVAQTNSNSRTTGHDHGNMEHPERTALNDTQTTNAAVREKAEHRHALVWTDATRLAALLHDLRTEVNISESLWRTIANEANTLANRIHGRTARARSARALATEVRTHVRALRQSALRGDAPSARRHASEAMPSLYQLIDWAG